jgi:hypothetical protein
MQISIYAHTMSSNNNSGADGSSDHANEKIESAGDRLINYHLTKTRRAEQARYDEQVTKAKESEEKDFKAETTGEAMEGVEKTSSAGAGKGKGGEKGEGQEKSGEKK